MSDDTLYGYILKGSGKALPAGMHVKYSSNRPKVVSVNRDGVIRSVGTGVATITATVTYHGSRSSTSFVADIQ